QERELRAGEKRNNVIPMKEEKLTIMPESMQTVGIYSGTESLVSTIGSLLSFDIHSDYDENMTEYLKQLKKKKKKRGISR
ncbi:hypothetical protein EZS27_012782, partial [termite gut metagenome]